MGGVPPDDAVDDSTVPELPEDNATPFSPADPVADELGGTPQERAGELPQLDSTHQATDTNIQPEEVYEEGLPGAAEASEPNALDNVKGYDPEKDQGREAA